MTKRTPHGEERRGDPGRPAGEAFNDKTTTGEIYEDVESGHFVFVGPRGRTHVFTADGRHHTSFRTTAANRQRRVSEGKWERIGRDSLPDEVK